MSGLIYGFWDRLNESVKDSGLTKKEIAERMGVDRKVLYPSGYTMSGINVAKFCVTTKTDANWLLGIKR